jgi:hypothetical protein
MHGEALLGTLPSEWSLSYKFVDETLCRYLRMKILPHREILDCRFDLGGVTVANSREPLNQSTPGSLSTYIFSGLKLWILKE